jgi:hypothetical protein
MNGECSNMNEMKIIENVQKFTWNFDDIKKELTDHVKKYDGLVVNDDNLADMENTQREIASTRTKLSKFRLAVKKELDKPFEVFDHQVKELLGLVENVERPIKDQLEKYENRRRKEKSQQVQQLIDDISAELGLSDKYSKNIAIADKYLNRGQKNSDTKEDIQFKIAYFLDIQQKDIEAATFKQQKVEMAKFMCESLSAGLTTPLRFEEIENRIDSLDIGALRLNIEKEVASRKEREDRAARLAVERAEKERLAEIAIKEREEQERIERERRHAELERNQSVISESKNHIEHIQRLAEINKPPDPIEEKPDDKLFIAQFVLYGVDSEQIEYVKSVFNSNGFNFKHSIREAVEL